MTAVAFLHCYQKPLGDVCNNTGHFYSTFHSVIFLSFGNPHLFWTWSKIPSNGQAGFFPLSRASAVFLPLQPGALRLRNQWLQNYFSILFLAYVCLEATVRFWVQFWWVQFGFAWTGRSQSWVFYCRYYSNSTTTSTVGTTSGQGAMGTNWGTGSSVWTWGRTSSLWGWQSTGTGCPGRLWSLLLWRYWRPTWTSSSTACCRWPCFSRRVGLDDPQRSLPTPTILWFCNILSFFSHG